MPKKHRFVWDATEPAAEVPQIPEGESSPPAELTAERLTLMRPLGTLSASLARRFDLLYTALGGAILPDGESCLTPVPELGLTMMRAKTVSAIALKHAISEEEVLCTFEETLSATAGEGFSGLVTTAHLRKPGRRTATSPLPRHAEIGIRFDSEMFAAEGAIIDRLVRVEFGMTNRSLDYYRDYSVPIVRAPVGVYYPESIMSPALEAVNVAFPPGIELPVESLKRQ